MGEREADGLYQHDRFRGGQRLVARVREPVVDEAAQEIHFAEIYQSDELVLADECEFGKYRILVKRVGYAARVDKEAPHKGRVLREVTAKLLGYTEQ